jgi:hypothetical protein
VCVCVYVPDMEWDLSKAFKALGTEGGREGEGGGGEKGGRKREREEGRQGERERKRKRDGERRLGTIRRSFDSLSLARSRTLSLARARARSLSLWRHHDSERACLHCISNFSHFFNRAGGGRLAVVILFSLGSPTLER